jgi:hypothetical protein
MDPEFKGGDGYEWFFWLWKYDRKRLLRDYMTETARKKIDSRAEDYKIEKETHPSLGIKMQSEDAYIASSLLNVVMHPYDDPGQQKLKNKFYEDYAKLIEQKQG